MSGDFRTAGDILAERAKTPGLAAAAIPAEAIVAGPLVVAPEMSIDQAKALWTAALDLRDVILGDRECYDVIDESRQMNRTGATRLAMAFGLSVDMVELHEGRVEIGDGQFDYRYLVRVRVGKGTRHVEGIGSCRISEISEKSKDKGQPGTPDFRPGKPVPMGQREHFALTKAWTRAAKRAIADILGGTDAD